MAHYAKSELFYRGHLKVQVMKHFSLSSKRCLRLVMCQTFGTIRKSGRGEVKMPLLLLLITKLQALYLAWCRASTKNQTCS